MTVYVDDMRLPAKVGRIQARWSHLTTDGPDEELHAFAARIGLRRSWFQDDPDPLFRHYDVTDTKRRAAIAAGAVAESWRDTGRRIHAARQARAAGQPPPAAAPRPGQQSLFPGD